MENKKEIAQIIDGVKVKISLVLKMLLDYKESEGKSIRLEVKKLRDLKNNISREIISLESPPRKRLNLSMRKEHFDFARLKAIETGDNITSVIHQAIEALMDNEIK